MIMLFLALEDRATLRSDLSANAGFTKESDAGAYHSFLLGFQRVHSPLENSNAINLGSGQSPVSRRLLYLPIPLRFRIDSELSITTR